jgi:FixJ family two-component response regulator
MPVAKPTVFVVDDDVSVRESLEALIGEAGWRAVVFESAGAFLAYSPPAVPGCLVLDVSLPDLSGLELQQRLLKDSASIPIVFITGHGDIPMTVQAMKAGAVEFLTKPFTPDALLGAIESALQASRAYWEQEGKLRALRERYDSLSRREREVMSLVVQGRLNKQVGGELGIAEITVKAHRSMLMKKMGARSLAELVKMAARLGIG